MQVKVADSKGRIAFGQHFANRTFIVEEVDATEMRIIAAVVIPDRELQLLKGIPATANLRNQQTAIDAAYAELAKSQKPMTAKKLVEAMSTSGSWTSPAGKTPDRTLAVEIGREIKQKGSKARFRKVAPGVFALSNARAD